MALFALLGADCHGSTTPTTPSPVAGTAYAFDDEFDGPANAAPDTSKWRYDTGSHGFGNNELQTYTDARANAHLDGAGHLIIHVDRTASGYTSARLKTEGVFSAKFGHIEARLKLPTGRGLWSTFWMLGANFSTIGWPSCGEVDIMENVGQDSSTNTGSVHGPGYSGGGAISQRATLPGGRLLSDDFHVFAIDWTAQAITFLLDGTAYQTVTPATLPPGGEWVFDRPFFLLLNVAVGGNLPGPPDDTTVFPQEMVVDYIRVTSPG